MLLKINGIPTVHEGIDFVEKALDTAMVTNTGEGTLHFVLQKVLPFTLQVGHDILHGIVGKTIEHCTQGTGCL